jgi:hypothetical protein
MSQKPSIPTGSTKSEIRCLAVFVSAWMWCLGLGFGQNTGTGSSAVTSSAAAALCGLAAWFTYHIVSQQNNGLIIVTLNAPAIWSLHAPFWSIVSHFLPMSVAVAGLIGLSARGLEAWKARKLTPGPTQPLYDAQFDHPT